MTTPARKAFRCSKCKSTASESVRVRDGAGRIVSWVQCARCSWVPDQTAVQFAFPFDEETNLDFEKR